MASELTTDHRGRVTIPPSMRHRHGRRYIAIDMPDGIHLFPVPQSPLRGTGLASGEAKRIARQEIDREVEEEYRRIHGGKLPAKR